jgi:hypothetical protein
MTGQETRNKLTDFWKESGVTQKDEFALHTNIIHQEWTGLSHRSTAIPKVEANVSFTRRIIFNCVYMINE